MSDLEIDIGYIGKEVFAFCHDIDHRYVIHLAEIKGKPGEYVSRVQSSDGVATTGLVKRKVSDRQMVMLAMMYHMEERDRLMKAKLDSHYRQQTDNKGFH